MEWNESARLTLDCECRARKSAGPARSNGISKATSATFSNKLTDRGPIKKEEKLDIGFLGEMCFEST